MISFIFTTSLRSANREQFIIISIIDIGNNSFCSILIIYMGKESFCYPSPCQILATSQKTKTPIPHIMGKSNSSGLPTVI